MCHSFSENHARNKKTVDIKITSTYCTLEISIPLTATGPSSRRSLNRLTCVFISAVGWGGTLPGHRGPAQRGSNAVAPYDSQALPHPAVRVLQPRHPGGSSGSSAEPGRGQLEGSIILVLKQ